MNFDDVAKVWDDERRIKRAKIIADKIKTTTTVSNDKKTAMEFGCGTGLISFNLVNDFRKITLIDNSQEMINIVNDKITKMDVDNIKSCCFDLVKNSLEEKFDIIYSSMALHHVIDIDALIKKFYNMINLAGIICIVDLNEDDGSFHKNEIGFNGHNGFSQEWMKNILKENGFRNVVSETFHEDTKQVDNKELDYSLFIMTATK